MDRNTQVKYLKILLQYNTWVNVLSYISPLDLIKQDAKWSKRLKARTRKHKTAELSVHRLSELHCLITETGLRQQGKSSERRGSGSQLLVHSRMGSGSFNPQFHFKLQTCWNKSQTGCKWSLISVMNNLYFCLFAAFDYFYSQCKLSVHVACWFVDDHFE